MNPKRDEELTSPRSLRTRVARGVLVNGGFHVGLNGLGLLRGLVAAALLTTAEFGIWGILALTLGSFLALKQIGVGERFVQQDEPDQRLAFQQAFTVELVYTGVFGALMVAAVPLLALAYDQPDLVAPGLALVTVLPAVALQSPVWVFYRRLQFGRQRLLQGIDPVVTFIVTVVLAVVGLGYWSIVIGAISGAWLAAAAALRFAPHRPRFRPNFKVLREYSSFSIPLLVAALSTMIAAQASLFVGERALGLAGAGAIYLVVSISFYANKLDEVITQVLYPAICAVRDRADLLVESFMKSNRLAMLWGIPAGTALALFAGDLVEFALGEKWRLAEAPLRVFGAIAAVNQVGFNWNAFLQAEGRTRPIAVAAFTSLLLTAAIALPLLSSDGLTAFAIGMVIVTVVLVAQRLWYLRSLFPVGRIVSNGAAAAAPALAGAIVVLAARVGIPGSSGLLAAVAEIVIYLVTVIALTLVVHRGLLRETMGYLRARAQPPPLAEAPL